MSTTSGQAQSTVDAAKAQQAVFHLDHIAKVYRMGETEIHALRDVDLDLQAGEFVVMDSSLRRRGWLSAVPCSPGCLWVCS